MTQPIVSAPTISPAAAVAMSTEPTQPRQPRQPTPLRAVLLPMLLPLAMLAGLQWPAWIGLGPADRAAQEAVAAQRPAIGHIDQFSVSPQGQLQVSGWALRSGGLREVALFINGRRVAELRSGIGRADVAAAFPAETAAALSGFEGSYTDPLLAQEIATIEVAAVGRDGSRTALLQRTEAPPGLATRWQPALAVRGYSADDTFFIPIATSNLAAGGAEGIKEAFAAVESPTARVGVRVQILYLRTTRGAAGDYAFDPDFIPDKRCGANRLVAEDSLNGVIRYAIAHQLPVLFTLNGGIWADSACDAPQWDINDVLEQDARLCQWSEKNEVVADNFLSNLAGSYESPELARSLSLNVYAERMRTYKRRNLQQAAAAIARFAQAHPDLFIGISVDPDVYMNPFFTGRQIFDYNPDTLRQFREWLQGTGPYAGTAAAPVPDLSRYRRAQPLTLKQASALAGVSFANWAEVDPPRSYGEHIENLWKNPWYAEWEHFRRHLVALHYSELSQWIAEAGINPRVIYSAQGFAPPGKGFDPVPVRLDSPVKNYDSGGVSIEGSVPSHGHLGAIVYGPSAGNTVPMERQRTLFSEFRHFDRDWAIVEYNTAALETPHIPATYADAYRSLREIVNHGARLVSPMAWNGTPGDQADTPGFVSYTSLRRAPLENAIRDVLRLRAHLPRSARLWEFGSGLVADDDRWTVDGRPLPPSQPGQAQLRIGGDGTATLQSPADLAARAADYPALVLQASPSDPDVQMRVEAQSTPNGAWRDLVARQPWKRAVAGPAGATWPLAQHPTGSGADAKIDRLRITWYGIPGSAIPVGRVVLYPAPRQSQP